MTKCNCDGCRLGEQEQKPEKLVLHYPDGSIKVLEPKEDADEVILFYKDDESIISHVACRPMLLAANAILTENSEEALPASMMSELFGGK